MATSLLYLKSLCDLSLRWSVSLEHNNVGIVTIQSLYVLCSHDELNIFVLCTSTYVLHMFLFLNNLDDHESYLLNYVLNLDMSCIFTEEHA
jgi:hypothetical protein